ncbi:MAG TPA: hypothetical protein VKD26_04330 [Streptosporangiaceae bacterium]|nr:hypothetical protein [Streptosporangiaceae bacterium]
MKKFSAAGTLVAASAAVAVIGFGGPAFASVSSVAHGLHPALTGHVLRAAGAEHTRVLGAATANKCDGDGDGDDVNCGAGPNMCDGDHDGDDVNCGAGTSGVAPHTGYHHYTVSPPDMGMSGDGGSVEHGHGLGGFLDGLTDGLLGLL